MDNSDNQSDKIDLKKRLALLRKEYHKRSKALEKHDRREKRKAHVTQKLQEQAASSSPGEPIPCRKPSKVTFLPDVACDVDKSKPQQQIKKGVIESPRLFDKLCESPVNSQLDFSDSLERKVGRKRKKKKKEYAFVEDRKIHDGKCKTDIGVSNNATAVTSKKPVVEKDTLDSLDTSIELYSQNVHEDPQNDAKEYLEIDTQFQLVDSEENNDLMTEKRKEENKMSPTVDQYSSNDTDEIVIPEDRKNQNDSDLNQKNDLTHVACQPKVKRRFSSGIDLLDFSFLDEDGNDLYSQVKQRRRRTNKGNNEIENLIKSPSPIMIDSQIAQSSSSKKQIKSKKFPSPEIDRNQSSQDTMDMSLSPSLLHKSNKSGKEKDVIVIDSDSPILSDKNETPKVITSRKTKSKIVEQKLLISCMDSVHLDSSEESVISRSKSKESKVKTTTSDNLQRKAKSYRRRSLPAKLTSKTSQDSASQDSVTSVMKYLISEVEKSTTESQDFALPESEYGKLKVDKVSSQSIEEKSEDGNRNQLCENKESGVSMHLHIGASSPLVTSNVNTSSQADFKSQRSSSSRRCRGRVRGRGRGRRHSLPASQDLSTQSTEESVSSATEIVQSQDDHVQENPNCPLKLAATIYEVGKVISLCCVEILRNGQLVPSILTCTSSHAVIWLESSKSNWESLYTFPVKEGENYLGMAVISNTENDPKCALVAVTLAEVSYLFTLLPLGEKEGSKQVILDEIPVMQKISRCPPIICPLQASVIITRPYPEQRNHTDLTSYPLCPELNGLSGVSCKLDPAPGKLLDVVAVDGCPGPVVLGICKKTLYIWNTLNGKLLREIPSPYSMLHCSRAVTEGGLVFLPVLVDSVEEGGGGLLVINPNTAAVKLVSCLQTSTWSSSRNHRWQTIAGDGGDIVCVMSRGCTAVYSTYWGQLVAYLASGGASHGDAAAVGANLLAVVQKGRMNVYTVESQTEH